MSRLQIGTGKKKVHFKNVRKIRWPAGPRKQWLYPRAGLSTMQPIHASWLDEATMPMRAKQMHI
jgi:hypothetical protein